MGKRAVIALDIGTKAKGSGAVAMVSEADENRPVSAQNTRIVWGRMQPNSQILSMLESAENTFGVPLFVVFEGLSSYGKRIGESTINTLLWMGRMIHAYDRRRDFGETRSQIVLRRTVAAHLVGSRRKGDPTMDTMVKHAVAERFGGMGATLQSVKGKASDPGPCYGFSEDIWQAAGLAIAYLEGAETEEKWRQ